LALLSNEFGFIGTMAYCFWDAWHYSPMNLDSWALLPYFFGALAVLPNVKGMLDTIVQWIWIHGHYDPMILDSGVLVSNEFRFMGNMAYCFWDASHYCPMNLESWALMPYFFGSLAVLPNVMGLLGTIVQWIWIHGHYGLLFLRCLAILPNELGVMGTIALLFWIIGSIA
jgi:hypothetical protein